jgi:hypothetical protein
VPITAQEEEKCREQHHARQTLSEKDYVKDANDAQERASEKELPARQDVLDLLNAYSDERPG